MMKSKIANLGPWSMFSLVLVLGLALGRLALAACSTPTTAPATGPTFSAISNTSVTVSWTSPSTGGNPLHYDVTRADDAAFTLNVVTPPTGNGALSLAGPGVTSTLPPPPTY